MSDLRISGLGWQEHPDSNRVTHQVQRGVVQPPSKLKSHFKWFLVVVGSILLATAVALALHVALPISLAASLGICIGTTSFFGLVTWFIKGYKLGSLWEKYNIWQEVLKKMPEEGSRSPALIQALQDVQDVVFEEGDLNKLAGTYEHMEVLYALAQIRLDGVKGISFVEDKGESWYWSGLYKKLEVVLAWMEWAEYGSNELTRASRKKICRTVLSSCLMGVKDARLEFSNEHLTPEGILELPYNKSGSSGCVTRLWSDLRQCMHRTKTLNIDLSECSKFKGFTELAKRFIQEMASAPLSLPGAHPETIVTKIWLPKELPNDRLQAMAYYARYFANLRPFVAVHAHPLMHRAITEVLRGNATAHVP